MSTIIPLGPSDARSAASIQQAIDALGPAGGRVVLPEGEFTLDRGLELRSRVELCGQGQGTVLRKAPGRIYPFAAYHNYGMVDVPLEFTDGLLPGMTVALRDQTHRGFYETFARLTWVEDNWVGLDHGMQSDYLPDREPVLVTAFPLIFGLGVEDVAIRNLTLDGNRSEQPAAIDSCRGAAIYFIRSRSLLVSDVEEAEFAGEGLGFQMCRDVRIERCSMYHNAGNGFHPGAGSTGASFVDCTAEANDLAGLFFCVRANHMTVRDCTFGKNRACGISVGTRDCHNRIEGCRLLDNEGPGILFRQGPRPIEVHTCRVSACYLENNARVSGRGQIDVHGDAHDLALTGNTLLGPNDDETAGIYIAPQATGIWLAGNRIERCSPATIADRASLAGHDPELPCGVEAVHEAHYRHLPDLGRA
jgi:hypothetical protein